MIIDYRKARLEERRPVTRLFQLDFPVERSDRT